MSNSSQSIAINPWERELIAMIKKAACQHFEITEEQLISGRSRTLANIRFLCYYLIVKSTGLKDYEVASVFNRTRTTVIYGLALIDVHRKVYRQSLVNLQSIAKIADNFEKKFPWHIHQPSTTN